MRFEVVLRLLGSACLVLAVALCVPLVLCLVGGAGGAQAGPDVASSELTRAFFLAAVISACLGLGLRFAFAHEPGALGVAEVFGAMTLSWLLCTVLGALPFLLGGHVSSLLDGCFETLSGLTSTGATLLPDPSALPRPLLLWRSLTQALGCGGFLVLSVALLPDLGAGDSFRTTSAARGEGERLVPRLRTGVRWIVPLLLLITLLDGAVLGLAGMGPFDALCHGLSVASAGGFSTRPDSLAGFAPAVQWTALACMFVAGLDVVLIGALLQRRVGLLLRSAEARVFVILLLLAAAALPWLRHDPAAAAGDAQHALFAATSALTGSGLRIEDTGLWAPAARLLLLPLILCGACARSPSSGVKLWRLMLLSVSAWREVARVLRPAAVIPLRLAGRVVDDVTASRTAAVVVLFLLVFVGGALTLVRLGLDVQGALGAGVSCLGNAAEGTQALGCDTAWADFPAAGKWACMLLMLVGRLEVCAVLVLLAPQARRR